MKKFFYTLWVLATFTIISCNKQSAPKGYNTDPLTNYKALWTALDQGYCFFDEKLPSGTTWQDVYDKYLPQIKEKMTPDELFEVMKQLMNELKDGHVNLFTEFDITNYDQWAQSDQSFLNHDIRYRYLSPDPRRAGPIYYKQISYKEHATDSIGLMVCSSFSNSISEANIHAVLSRFANCKGLIIDVRNNGGGLLGNADRLTSHFLKERSLVAYISSKTGPGHQQFGPLQPIYLSPANVGIIWDKPVIVLANRASYSAANSFVVYMHHAPKALFVGDTTGGGGGLPISSELPNGWWLRYSSSRMYNADKNIIEFGVSPDYRIPQSPEATDNGEDALIEHAIKLIKERSN